ncbi:hypothetical protein TNCV_3653031 [Trichonephila clavipes]|nr:hypothetical protein TNCV_3653031 [Trichonephila clavipes]
MKENCGFTRGHYEVPRTNFRLIILRCRIGGGGYKINSSKIETNSLGNGINPIRIDIKPNLRFSASITERTNCPHIAKPVKNLLHFWCGSSHKQKGRATKFENHWTSLLDGRKVVNITRHARLEPAVSLSTIHTQAAPSLWTSMSVCSIVRAFTAEELITRTAMEYHSLLPPIGMVSLSNGLDCPLYGRPPRVPFSLIISVS